jgi:hypothetical protein
MNNYDFNYNNHNPNDAEFINGKNYLKLNDLRWMNIFLSILISIFIFYISYRLANVLNFVQMKNEIELSNLKQELAPIKLMLTLCIGLSIADMIHSYFSMNKYINYLLFSEKLLEINFVWFIIYITLFKILFLIILRYAISKITYSSNYE